MLDRIDHVGIACHDLAAKIAFYESVFDLTVVSREVNEEQGVREAMLRVAAATGGSSWIQLLEPLGPDTPVGRFLARRGERLEQLDPGRAAGRGRYPQHRLTDTLLLIDLAAHHGEVEDRFVEGDLGGEVVAGDPDMVDSVQHHCPLR